MKTLNMAIGAALVCACLSATGEEIPTVTSVEKAGDAAGVTAFADGTKWSNGLPPGPGTNYVWNSYVLRTPDPGYAPYKSETSFAFPGESLEITAGAIAHKTRGADVTLTWPNLIWNYGKGNYSQAAAANSLGRVLGTITVKSDMKITCEPGTEEGKSHYDFSFENRFVGDAGKTITATHSKAGDLAEAPCFVRVSGDNADFEGRWLVQNVDAAHVGIVLCLESANALGKTPEAADAAALTLENDGGISVSPTLAQPFQPQYKGLTVKGDASVGGRLVSISNETWALGMPVSGSGRLMKTGSGKVRLRGQNLASRAALVAEGTLAISDGFSAADAATLSVEVASGATFAIEPLTTDGLTVAGVSLPPETLFVLPVGETGATVGKVTLDASCTWSSGPVRIRLDGSLASVSAETRVEVLAVPVSVRTLTAADVVDVSEGGGDVVHGFAVETTDGIQRVYVELRPVVYTQPTAAGDSSKWWFTTASGLWTDNQACHGGVDYVCTNSISFRTGAKQADTAVVFPGASLTMTWGILSLKQSDVFFTNLTLKAKSRVSASGSSSQDGRQRLGGTLTLGGTRSDPIEFYGQAAQNCSVYADLRGDGVACFAVWSSAKGENAVGVFAELTGDNSRYTGSFIVDEKASSTLPRNDLTNMTLRVAAADSLGGRLSSFTYDALRLRPYAGLQPMASFTLDARNRGIYLDGGPCRFVMDEGVEWTVMETISYAGQLRKEGAGTLALGGDHRICSESAVVEPDGENSRLYVREGWIKPAGTNAFTDLKIVFGSAGGLRLDADPTDAGVKAYGLFNAATDTFVLEGGTLPVKVDLAREVEREFSVVLCTVRPAVAEAIRGKLDLARPCRGFGLSQLTEDSVTIGGETYTRLTATFARRGSCLIIR